MSIMRVDRRIAVHVLQFRRSTNDLLMCDGSGRPLITVGIVPMHFAGL
jgi:hypothetical protein